MTELETFFENQKEELSIRKQELELEREKNLIAEKMEGEQLTLAREHLAAIERDRQNDREYRKTLDKKTFGIAIIFIIAVTVFLTVAVLKDKDAMIIELVKAVAYGAPWGIGGYAFGRFKKKNGVEDN